MSLKVVFSRLQIKATTLSACDFDTFEVFDYKPIGYLGYQGGYIVNKLTFDNYISSEPCRPSAVYLCEDRGICDNIIASGRAAVYISSDLNNTAFFSMDEYLAYIEN